MHNKIAYCDFFSASDSTQESALAASNLGSQGIQP
jgi:hypothetical protein